MRRGHQGLKQCTELTHASKALRFMADQTAARTRPLRETYSCKKKVTTGT